MTRLESQLADAIVRMHRQPDIRETMLEALFALRRAYWVAAPDLSQHRRHHV